MKNKVCPSEHSPSITACGMGKRDVHQANRPLPSLEKEIVVFAFRMESLVSSSGVKVLSVFENTDQRYAL
jgi:hypothetical protein